MKEVLKFIINTVTFFISIVTVILLILYVIGIVPTVISSGSMEPAIPTGSLCMINRNYPFEKIKVNDIIVYYQPEQKVIHRVVKVSEQDVRTKGDANDFVDRLRATKNNYYGKFMFSVPQVGYFLIPFQSTPGKIIFAMVIILLYIDFYILNRKEKQNGNN